MNAIKIIALVVMAIALSAVPVVAQEEDGDFDEFVWILQGFLVDGE